ncbi:hypothetical protein ALC57_09921 [Trachymyrmex cornetzi]|uniref:Uncharacterized protein n=1 Tax=Trachymyrmex cornetzi TaxID=471704 RepID=A0A151J4T9_9HYME|nr:hypothetical protein ALC57_09921 [Trachymyrmex cornetzi]
MKGERIEEECEGVGMGPGGESKGKDEREDLVVGIYFKGIHDGRVNSFSRGSLASSQITGPLIRAQTRITGGGMQKDVKDGHREHDDHDDNHDNHNDNDDDGNDDDDDDDDDAASFSW